MENPIVLLPLNERLSVKSAAILCCVSKTTRMYIKPKNYSFYRIFKQLDLKQITVIKMLFESDRNYSHIGFHKNIKGIIRYITRTRYGQCVSDLELLINEGVHTGFVYIHFIDMHCRLYTSYVPLQELLKQQCYNKFL
jgi:hypothetical protein